MFVTRSLGATILEFILETSVWDIHSLMEEFEIENSSLAIQKVRISFLNRDLRHETNACNSNISEIIDTNVSLVIRGRYLPSFWTMNPEFEDMKAIFEM